MGRRSQHKPEELRELILAATQRLVEEQGIDRISARVIAREIDYAAGTLYNMFDNLDDILLRVEARFHDELDQCIGEAIEERKGLDALRHLAAAYIGFAYRRRNPWALIQRLHPDSIDHGPDWYLEKVYAPLQRIERILEKMMVSRDPNEISRAAQLLWSSIHGMAVVTTTTKFGSVPPTTASAMVETLAERILAGETAVRPSRSDNGVGHRDSAGHLG